jgi:Domain of unknown function (DUF6249)
MDKTTLALLIPLAGIIAGTGMLIAVFWLILHFRSERVRTMYDTAIKLADKNQPVPPELFQQEKAPTSDLRRGLVLLLFGIGLSISLYEVGAPWTFGLIPALMGVGYLIVWRVEKKQVS